MSLARTPLKRASTSSANGLSAQIQRGRRTRGASAQEKCAHHGRLAAPGVPAYLYMRELIQQGYVGQVLAVNMMLMGSGVLTRPSDRTWQRDVTLGANTLTITFGHVLDAMCMVVGELTEVSAIVATQVPQWFETDTKNM